VDKKKMEEKEEEEEEEKEEKRNKERKGSQTEERKEMSTKIKNTFSPPLAKPPMAAEDLTKMWFALLSKRK
jgi:hypothetical protein